MNTSRRTRGVLASIVAGAVVIAGSLLGGSAASATVTASPPPTSMAALGDSITQALMTCSSLSGCPTNSWSTGTTTSVNSHAQRLRTLFPGVALTAYNDSVSGAASGALLGQAQKAISQGAQYVTIEIGANDACTKTVATMTPVATYQANVTSALTALANSPAHPEIFVATIPSIAQLYTVNKNNASARFTWAILGICQSMLANPTSTKQADIDRRNAVQAQVNAYNVALKAACAATNKCRFDNNVVATNVFSPADIGTRDYFHPSLAGQTKLAAITWAVTQWVS